MGATMKMPVDSAKVGSDVLAYLSNWQNWSALLATVSSVLVVLTGFITRLSGWLITFHQSVRDWLTLKYVQQRTFRIWVSPHKPD